MEQIWQETFFNISRDITMEPFAKDVLHFKSPIAVQLFLNVVTLIKHQSLETFFYGFSQEMIQTYVKKCYETRLQCKFFSHGIQITHTM